MSAEPLCDLCQLPIKYRVVYPCNHRDICFECFVRLTECYHSHECYYCQKPVEKDPVVLQNENYTYEEAMAHNPHHDRFYFRFNNSVNTAYKMYHEFSCPDCDFKQKDAGRFQQHLKLHQKKLCFNCYNSGRYLPIDVPIYDKKSFGQHRSQHPTCILCKATLFDDNMLSKHMLENHIRCDICAKSNKIVWLMNEEELIRHNEKNHFVCHYPSCPPVIAFPTRGELILHLQSMHNEKGIEVDLLRDFGDEQQVQKEDPKAALQRIRENNIRFKKKLNTVFHDNPVAVDALRAEARNYMDNRINAQEFYKRFKVICGNKRNLVFNDMIAILPDQRKRVELLRLNRDDTISHPSTEESEHTIAKPTRNSSASISIQRKEDSKISIAIPKSNTPPPPPAESPLPASPEAAPQPANPQQPSRGKKGKGKKKFVYIAC